MKRKDDDSAAGFIYRLQPFDLTVLRAPDESPMGDPQPWEPDDSDLRRFTASLLEQMQLANERLFDDLHDYRFSRSHLQADDARLSMAVSDPELFTSRFVSWIQAELDKDYLLFDEVYAACKTAAHIKIEADRVTIGDRAVPDSELKHALLAWQVEQKRAGATQPELSRQFQIAKQRISAMDIPALNLPVLVAAFRQYALDDDWDRENYQNLSVVWVLAPEKMDKEWVPREAEVGGMEHAVAEDGHLGTRFGGPATGVYAVMWGIQRNSAELGFPNGQTLSINEWLE